MIAVTATLRAFFLALCAVFALGEAVGAAAEAGPASLWQKGDHARARLIVASGVPYRGRLVTAAGLEFSLDKGWKTYWRSPGDGLPTTIEWAASENLKHAEILWPAPKRLAGPDGAVSYVYADRVILPILITPKDPANPVQFRLQISYGVCADICVPVEAALQLPVPPATDATYRSIIHAALERVPKPQERGVYCPHQVIDAKRQIVGDSPALLVTTAFEDRVAGLDLFAEAPEGFDLPAPVLQPNAPRGRLYYLINFDTPQALEELSGQSLRLTAVSDQGSCEVNWRVK
jgi:DsbC/DsbD-like thiol-disulfide interchange protein